MRRPLCLIGLAFAAALAAGIACLPHSAPTCASLDGEKVTAAGRVEWKEHRISGGEEVLVVSLEQVIVLKPDQISDMIQIISDSEAIRPKHILAASVYETEKFYRKNKEDFSRADTGEITGVLCYLDKSEDPAMGSFVVVEGKFRAFAHAANPGEFDAADYYCIMGQQGRLMRSTCLAISPECDLFRERLYNLKEYLALLLDASYPEREAAVMRAMLLGEKGTLDTEIKSLYQQNGIMHILAISGLHLSILGMGFYKILKKLRIPNAVNIILSITVMYCYGNMTGMGISVVRALVMFGLHLGAGLLGRTYDMLTAMTAAALSVLIQQPLYLTQSGFLFSFGAICGIGLFLPAMERHRLSENRFVRSLCAGIGVSLSTLPVYLVFYCEFPPYSVLLNLIVIPCMSLVLLGGIIAVTAAAFILPAGRYAALPGTFLLKFYEKCCSISLELPGHRWITGCPSKWQVLLFILLLAGVIVFSEKLRKWQFWTVVIGAVAVLSVRPFQGFEITMLDVGQGDCIYLADGQGGHYLIDGGSSDKKDVEDHQIIPFLKYRGVSRLDAVFVTHPDGDHISGIRAMLEETGTDGILIRTLYLPDVGDMGRNEAYCELEALAAESGVPVLYIRAGDVLQNGKVMLTCLNPKRGWNTEDTNAYSTVLYLTCGKFSALFTGDLEGEGEQAVLSLIQSARSQTAQSRSGEDMNTGEPDLRDITLLKVAHHGSRNSSSEDFLRAVNPRIALISAGRDNRYGHPHEELLDRLDDLGCLIRRTQESGAVTVRVRGEKVTVREYLLER